MASFVASRETYGTPRILLDLQASGCRTSRRRIGRLMAHMELRPRCRRRFVVTTESDHEVAVPNRLDRAFEPVGPNRVWVSDITYLWASTRWVYLCTIRDCWSGAIVGRKVARCIDAPLVLDTLTMAIAQRRPPAGCIFHSDRGSQYASDLVLGCLNRHGFVRSMSRKANCWDNAPSESFFGRLKAELGDAFLDSLDATVQVYDYIDNFYNTTRLFTRIGMAPTVFESLHDNLN